MAVVRVNPNMLTPDPAGLAAFYARVFDLSVDAGMGWIAFLQGADTQPPLLQLASEGGAGTPLPAITIEVDDLDDALARLAAEGIAPTYGPVHEAWGIRRFFFRDPAGTLVNVAIHE